MQRRLSSCTWDRDDRQNMAAGWRWRQDNQIGLSADHRTGHWGQKNVPGRLAQRLKSAQSSAK